MSPAQGFDPDRRFFVAHMQKTAGTTLRDRLRSTFAEEQIYPNASDGPDARISVISLKHLQQRWHDRSSEIRLLTGHFPVRTPELLDPPAKFVTVTVLRDPVERTLSFLRHQGARNQRGATEDTPLVEIYEDPFRFSAMIQNHMTRTLSLTPEEMLRGDGVLTTVPYDRGRLEMAKQALAELDLFGLQHRLEEFCDELASRYGLDVGEPMRSNTTESSEPASELAERIAHDNALDMELYEYACQLYAQRHPETSAAEPSSRANTSPQEVLAEAEKKVAAGDSLAAVELLHAANQRQADSAIEIRLAQLRNQAFDELKPASKFAQWPVPAVVDREEAPQIPKIAPAELSAQRVRQAISTHGSAHVPGLLNADQVSMFVEGIEHVIKLRNANGAAAENSSSWFAGLPLPREQAQSLARNWVAGDGGVLACDSPKLLDTIFATYEAVGLREVVAEYLGERPALSANKATLRKARLDGKTDWHQDGAFLGSGIRALNVWVALTDCGVDAPGMDLVPRRFEEVQETGTGGAIFDWAVGPDTVAKLAVEHPVVRPHFKAGDVMLFDDLFLHRTALDPSMTVRRYALETWFFAPTDYPDGQVPLVW